MIGYGMQRRCPWTVTTRLVRALAVGLLMLGLAVPPARAQRDGDDRADVDVELRQAFEQVMVERLRRHLDLSDDQEEDVVPLMKELFHLRREAATRRLKGIRSLHVLSEDGEVDESVIARRLEGFHRDQREALEEELRLRQAIASHLSPRQSARLLGFEERLRQDFRDRVSEFRDRRPMNRRPDRRPPRRR